jgi:hypothetical protein
MHPWDTKLLEVDENLSPRMKNFMGRTKICLDGMQNCMSRTKNWIDGMHDRMAPRKWRFPGKRNMLPALFFH